MSDQIQLTPEQICATIKDQIDLIEQQMANSMGMQLYKQLNGFSQEEIYKLCGRNDDVATITVRSGSESEDKYGNEITLSFTYTHNERKKLEQDSASLNEEPKVRAKALLYDYDTEKAQLLSSEGINTHDIVAMIIAPATANENLFYGKEKRKPHVLEIPFEGRGNGEDIFWMYGAFKHFMADGIALTHEEHYEYLAYRLIIEPQALTADEKKIIFDEEGRIANNDVALPYLTWKEESHRLRETDKTDLARLRYMRMMERLAKLDDALKGVGGLTKFAEKYPEKAKLIVDKVLRFRDKRYNVVGKHLLCMDLNSFIHIYLRHVEELKNNQIYGERTKFQLREEDVEIVISHVLHDLNNDYQKFKDEHPDCEYRKFSDQAYYYNGDYYAIRIKPDGRLETFYKLGDRIK